MFGVLLILFLLVPIVELAVIVQVADQIGLAATLGTLVLFSVAGAWLCKREGYGVLRRVQDQLDRGQLPTRELVDGLLIVVGGTMLLFPGFVTDAFGLLLLLPPVRAAVRVLLLRRYERRVTEAFAPSGMRWAGPSGVGFASGRVFTGTSTYDHRGERVVDVHEVAGDDADPTTPGHDDAPHLERP